jgi:hypothetical protein
MARAAKRIRLKGFVHSERNLHAAHPPLLTNVAADGLSEAEGVQRGVRHGQTKKAGEMRQPFVRSKYSALEDQS